MGDSWSSLRWSRDSWESLGRIRFVLVPPTPQWCLWGGGSVVRGCFSQAPKSHKCRFFWEVGRGVVACPHWTLKIHIHIVFWMHEMLFVMCPTQAMRLNSALAVLSLDYPRGRGRRALLGKRGVFGLYSILFLSCGHVFLCNLSDS